MFIRLGLLAVAMLSVAAAHGAEQIRVDIVTPDDGESTPQGLIAFDILLDQPDTGWWTASGMRLATQNGAQIEYSFDANSNAPILLNPGNDNRFVTSLSRPRPRVSSARYTNCGAAIIGDYCPTGSFPPIATPTELNVVWYSDPLPDPNTPGVGGALARIVLRAPVGGFCSGSSCCEAGVFPIDAVPPSFVTYLESECDPGGSTGTIGTVYATRWNVTPRGISWAFAVHSHLPCFYNLDDEPTTIGIGDLSVLLAAFGSCSGDPNYNFAAAELDQQPCVTLGDLAVLLAHFGDLCCVE